MSSTTSNIESVLQKNASSRRPKLFRAPRTSLRSKSMSDSGEAVASPEGFWARMRKSFTGSKSGHRPEWDAPHAEWFGGGKINISDNCLDRLSPRGGATKRPSSGRANRRSTTLTYQQLHTQVCHFANVLKRAGIEKGDRVASTCR